MLDAKVKASSLVDKQPSRASYRRGAHAFGRSESQRNCPPACFDVPPAWFLAPTPSLYLCFFPALAALWPVVSYDNIAHLGPALAPVLAAWTGGRLCATLNVVQRRGGTL